MAHSQNMTPEQYQAKRRLLGSQKVVAAALGIGHRTLQRREAGEVVIVSENVMALEALASGCLPKNLSKKKI
jgi:hypothetical protein